jgi:phosphodiesterase/alkaline phosphatase D-like protein
VEAFRTHRTSAYQAWQELHMLVCIDSPDGPDNTINQSFAHGDNLVRFPVLDTRQYRSDQQRNVLFVA